MRMGRRSQNQIELDCKRIQEAAKTASSMKEIGEKTGLTQSEIRTSLSKHPRITKKVQKQVEENKVAAELEAMKKEKAQLKGGKPEEKKPDEKAIPQANKALDFEMGFVIDTSMAGVDAIHDLLCKICATDAKVILTSIVRQELNKMQLAKKDYLSEQAIRILSMAANRPEKFCNVLIDETLPTPDDCIVKYCADNKKRVVLLTADKNMALDAREQSIKVEFFKRGFKHVKSLSRLSKKDKTDVRTLYPARRIGNKLIIMEMQGFTRDICVCSGGNESVDGIVELRVGDDVLIASKKTDCITLAHYKMLTVYEEDNCKQIFFRKFYNYDEIDTLSNESYKKFAKAFWNKHNLEN